MLSVTLSLPVPVSFLSDPYTISYECPVLQPVPSLLKDDQQQVATDIHQAVQEELTSSGISTPALHVLRSGPG